MINSVMMLLIFCPKILDIFPDGSVGMVKMAVATFKNQIRHRHHGLKFLTLLFGSGNIPETMSPEDKPTARGGGEDGGESRYRCLVIFDSEDEQMNEATMVAWLRRRLCACLDCHIGSSSVYGTYLYLSSIVQKKNMMFTR